MQRKKTGAGRLFESRAKTMELEIDQYLGLIDQSAMLFEAAIRKYIAGDMANFEKQTAEVRDTERQADELRRQITHRLYTDMLIPDSRGDVLGLLETTDNLADVAKRVANHFSIEKPEIFPFLKDDFIELTEISVKAVLELTLAVRAFFRDVYRVTEHLDKVHFWEHQADEVEDRLKRKAFENPDIREFSKRVHMRYFAERISLLADESEEVAERLAISAIKRNL